MGKPLLLLILDGYSRGVPGPGNAVFAANTPNLDRLFAEYPNTELQCSGFAVGLPEGQMGNSEVGHTNIGAGRVVYQELTRITKDIEDGGFFENPALLLAIENCKANNTALHLFGLLSDGGVHSHQTHLYALLELCRRRQFTNVYIHCFLDGRDTPPKSGSRYLSALQDQIKKTGVGRIATVMGRYYAMDRDSRWDRVQLAYDAIVNGSGEKAGSFLPALEKSYQTDVTDEFVKPLVGLNYPGLAPHDSVIFYNFRPDRAREITRSLVDPDFSGFDRPKGCFPLCYVCFTQYDATMPNVMVAFPPESLKNTMGEYMSGQGLKQLRIAETEKYAHVTFFFNGGVERVFPGEDRALIPSPKVATYDLQPEMSAYLVRDEVIKRINDRKYDLIVLNFANCDMVGHTGVFEAAVKAVEAVDACVGDVVSAQLAAGGVVMLTADHGNAEQMLLPDGSPMTAHTTSPVPLIVIGAGAITLRPGKLCDLAPTALALMGLEQPSEMTGQSVIE